MSRISKNIALVACFINVSNASKHSGFELGYNEATEFHIMGASGNDFLAGCYSLIFLLLFVFIIGKLVKKEILSHIICLSSLILIIFQYRLVYLQKNLFLINMGSFNKLNLETIPLDLLSFSLVLILLIFQIITAFQLYFDWKRNNAEVK